MTYARGSGSRVTRGEGAPLDMWLDVGSVVGSSLPLTNFLFMAVVLALATWLKSLVVKFENRPQHRAARFA